MAQPDGPEFHAVERSKVYSSIVDQILASIRSGRLPPGSALPAERVLAGRLGVSRGSLREAIRVLEHAGVLDVRVGSGTYVAQDSGSDSTVLRARAAAIGEHSPLDLMVARAALEPVCAEHAARSHHPSDLVAIEEAVTEQAELTHSGGDPAEADNAFHLAVAAASHNGVLVALQRTLVDLMHEQTWSELKHRSRSRPPAAEAYLEHHRLVLDAVRRRDARRAGRLMAMHMTAIETGLLAELDDPGPDGSALDDPAGERP